MTISFLYGFSLMAVREIYFPELEIPSRFTGRMWGSILGVGIPVFLLDLTGILTKYAFLRLTKKRPLSIPMEMILFGLLFAFQHGIVELLALNYYGYSPFLPYYRELNLLRARMKTSFVTFLFFYITAELYGVHLFLVHFLIP